MKLIELAKQMDEVRDWTWDAESYVKFAMSPLEKAIDEMLNDDPRKDALLALLNSGNEKIHEMVDRIQNDIGTLKSGPAAGIQAVFAEKESLLLILSGPINHPLRVRRKRLTYLLNEGVTNGRNI
jgi:hypothetical protein